jgi:PTH1 family peptidyl-tRNA hydrolase
MEAGAAPYLIVGLGNPDRAHRGTRHNIGFMLLDALAGSLELSFQRQKFDALITEGAIEGQKTILAKPQTYMNRSGRSVITATRYFKIPADQVLIILDDMDLPLGTIRLRASGGSGGHLGLASILQEIGPDLPRMRIGIGRPPGRMDPADYVLLPFKPDERELVDITLRKGLDCIRTYIVAGIEAAMNHCNPAD